MLVDKPFLARDTATTIIEWGFLPIFLDYIRAGLYFFKQTLCDTFFLIWKQHSRIHIIQSYINCIGVAVP